MSTPTQEANDAMVTVIERKPSPAPQGDSKRSAADAKPVSAAEAARRKAKGGLGQLYKPRTPIHPKLAHGHWRNIKWAMLVFTLGVYYVTPWIRWDRPGDLPDQAVLIDFAHARFYFFGLHLWPQEVYFVTGLLIMAALALFLSNALFGRLWCGYSCPQTIWTDFFITVERFFEGDRNARLKMDKAGWGPNKIARKTAKHATWLMIGFWTGGAWVLYFHDAPTVVAQFWSGNAPLTVYLSFAVLTLTTYAFAGLMREQVCFYLCPWPRIQGAMLDKDSLQVTYRKDRGEPRGPHKKDESWEGRGDCIDCNQCVVVCPMGIDIRDGSQFECINCGLCIDACDEVMDKVGRPRGLIGYDTDAAVAARACGQPPKYRLIRPRTIYYAVALGGVSLLMAWGLFFARADVTMNAIRDRNPVFVEMRDGTIRDGYTIKISNKTLEPQTFELSVAGLDDAVLSLPGGASGASVPVPAAADATTSVRLFVSAPPDDARAANVPITFEADAGEVFASAPAAFQSARETNR
jgi:cytochrome c oxidase accessory protein FixG